MNRVRHLAVLGSPIAHSKSPALHRAAYRALGVPWEYETIDVASGRLRPFLDALDSSWRGLSLTMPLKREVLPLLDELDAVGTTVGAANTVLFDDGRILGFNTDVHGISAALREVGIGRVDVVGILGSGATAASVMVAIEGMGATGVEVATRSPAKAHALMELAARLELSSGVGTFEVEQRDRLPGLVISTLPGDTPLVREFPADFRASVPLFEVAYDPWPTPLAQHWLDAGGTVHSGLGMLIHQALVQVRLFVGGDPLLPLSGEPAVLAAMRAAVGQGSDPGPIMGG